MPSFSALGDPRYQYWLTHTPRGTAVDDPAHVGPAQNAHVGYTGYAVSLYTHMGTHIDVLNHFGLNGEIYNGFAAEEHLGDRGWRRAGAETIPPMVARGVLIDVAAAKGLDELPPGYRIGAGDLRAALARQNVALEPGDVALIRTGRMRGYGDAAGFVTEAPGLLLYRAGLGRLLGRRFLLLEHVGRRRAGYARRHPRSARSLARFMGFEVDGSEADYREVAGELGLRFVSLEPRQASGDHSSGVSRARM